MTETASQVGQTSNGPSNQEGMPRHPDVEKRLNQVATTLIGSTAAVTAVFALLGANNERIWVLLDDSRAVIYLCITVLLALAAIALGLFALLARESKRAVGLLVAGAGAFVFSLAFAVWTAATGANQYAQPTVTEVAMEPKSPEVTVLTFKVRAPSLDSHQRIGVRVIDQSTREFRLDATLPPDEKGVAEQRIVLAVPARSGVILLAAWHRDDSKTGSREPSCEDPGSPPDGTICLTVRLSA